MEEQLSLLCKCKVLCCKEWSYWNSDTPFYCKEHLGKYYKSLGGESLKKYKKELRKKARQRRKKIPINRVKTNVRHRLKKLLKNTNQTHQQTSSFIGCTRLELQKHLESQFRPGMSWENYGTIWHVDHIRPLASFNLYDKQECQKANHYTNLQPLFAEENMKKGAKYDYSFIYTMR